MNDSITQFQEVFTDNLRLLLEGVIGALLLWFGRKLGNGKKEEKKIEEFAEYQVLLNNYNQTVEREAQLQDKVKSEMIKAEEMSKKLQDHSQSLILDLITASEINYIIYQIFKKTITDRFLILVANNGKTDPKYTTAIYEQHVFNEKGESMSVGATSAYVDMPIDEAYRDMLKYAEQVGPYEFDVANHKSCMLRDIYIDEEVKHSIIHFCFRMPINEVRERVFFCSFATHQDKPFNRVEKTVIKSFVSRINKTLNKFYASKPEIYN